MYCACVARQTSLTGAHAACGVTIFLNSEISIRRIRDVPRGVSSFLGEEQEIVARPCLARDNPDWCSVVARFAFASGAVYIRIVLTQ